MKGLFQGDIIAFEVSHPIASSYIYILQVKTKSFPSWMESTICWWPIRKTMVNGYS